MLDNIDKVDVPDVNPLHDVTDPSRTNSTYVKSRLLNEPRQGAPTNIPLVPIPSTTTGGGGGGGSIYANIIGAEDSVVGSVGAKKELFVSPDKEKKLPSSIPILGSIPPINTNNTGDDIPIIKSDSYKAQPVFQAQNASGFSGMLANMNKDSNNNNYLSSGGTGFDAPASSFLSKPTTKFQPTIMGGNVNKNNIPLGPITSTSNPTTFNNNNNNYGNNNNISNNLNNNNNNGFPLSNNLGGSGFGSGSGNGFGNNLGGSGFGSNNNMSNNGAGLSQSRFGKMAQFGMGMMGSSAASNNPGVLPALNTNSNNNNNSGYVNVNSYLPTTSVSAPISGANNGYGGRHKF